VDFIYIAFVGFPFEVIETKFSKFVFDLGGLVVSDISQASHLIASSMRKTLKFVCAINQCRYIVSIDWLIKSKESSNFLDEQEFILQDQHIEQSYHFSLKDTMNQIQSSKSKIFDDIGFYVMDDVQPSSEEMKAMIRSAGGKILARFPRLSDFEKGRLKRENWFIISSGTPKTIGDILEIIDEDHIQTEELIFKSIFMNVHPDILLTQHQ